MRLIVFQYDLLEFFVRELIHLFEGEANDLGLIWWLLLLLLLLILLWLSLLPLDLLTLGHILTLILSLLRLLCLLSLDLLLLGGWRRSIGTLSLSLHLLLLLLLLLLFLLLLFIIVLLVLARLVIFLLLVVLLLMLLPAVTKISSLLNRTRRLVRLIQVCAD